MQNLFWRRVLVWHYLAARWHQRRAFAHIRAIHALKKRISLHDDGEL